MKLLNPVSSTNSASACCPPGPRTTRPTYARLREMAESLAFRKAAPELEVIQAPVTDSQFYLRPRIGATMRQIRGILHEYAAIAYYWLRGEI